MLGELEQLKVVIGRLKPSGLGQSFIIFDNLINKWITQKIDQYHNSVLKRIQYLTQKTSNFC